MLGNYLNDQVGVVAAEVVKEYGDLVIDLPLEVALLMRGADK